MAFLMFAPDARPMLYSPSQPPRMELCERFETLADALENALMFWPEDGTVPILIYNDKGELVATLAPTGPDSLIVAVPGSPVQIYTSVHYVTDTSGAIVATVLTRAGETLRLTHPARPE